MDQVAWMLLALPSLNFNHIVQVYNSYYGLGTHWSAAVIYSVLFIAISKHFNEKLGIGNSLNLALTTGVVGLSIASFEFLWMGSYYYFQHQTWILSLQYPQLRIILQNSLFSAPGVILLLGLNRKEYRLNIDWKTRLFLVSTALLVIFWWYYPFPVQQLTVPLLDGTIWRSTGNFPQTMYTVDLNPLDNMAVGEMFHVQDEAVHLLNNLTKISMTMFFYSLFKIQRRENYGT